MRLVALGLVGSVVLLATGCGSASSPATASSLGPTDCGSFARIAAERAAHDVGSGPPVLVIGDSYSLGYGLADLDDSWPSRLTSVPARVHVAGYSGSGFADHDSACGAVSFAARAPQALAAMGPSATGALVVVQGGLNDWRQSDDAVRQGFDQLLAALRGHDVVVVGPVQTPPRTEQTRLIDHLLRRLCAGHDRVHYLSLLHLSVGYLSDQLHPDQAGQDAIGDRVAAELRRLR